MSEPTPRQVLYALVAGGFLAVVVVLVIGAAAAGLVPNWWTATMAVTTGVLGIWCGFNWRRTPIVLSLSIALFLVWTVGTLLVA